MENFFKTSKRGIIAILTLCILLGIAGTSVNVTAMAAETTVTAEETIIVTEDTTVVSEQITQELVPLMADDCPIYVPGIGWQGSQSWNNCVNTVAAGGTITDFGGIIVTESVAKLMISDAGGQYLSTENGHLTGSHSYRHVHYLMYGTRHNVIRIQ